jgi:hypothetical protein
MTSVFGLSLSPGLDGDIVAALAIIGAKLFLATHSPESIRTRRGTAHIIRYRVRTVNGEWKQRSETLYGLELHFLRKEFFLGFDARSGSPFQQHGEQTSQPAVISIAPPRKITFPSLIV